MSIHFDPKAKVLATSISNTEPAKQETTAIAGDPYVDPSQVVSEMDLLFSGMQKQQNLRAQNPVDPITIPDFQNDIMRKTPQLGDNSITSGSVINRYQLLKNNLIERRNNLSLTLESRISADEAFDILDRINEVDQALQTLQKNMDEALQADKMIREREKEIALGSQNGAS